MFAEGKPGETVHLGHIGEEGIVGLPVAVGASSSPVHAIVHGEGKAAQVDATAFAALLKRCPVLSHSLFVYSHALMMQIAQAALCQALHPVNSRFARWLLAAGDRLSSQTVTATQEHIAITLGVQRLAVQHVASEFQDAGLIRYRRGKIQIESRAGLKERACACYTVIDRIFKDTLQ